MRRSGLEVSVHAPVTTRIPPEVVSPWILTWIWRRRATFKRNVPVKINRLLPWIATISIGCNSQAFGPAARPPSLTYDHIYGTEVVPEPPVSPDTYLDEICQTPDTWDACRHALHHYNDSDDSDGFEGNAPGEFFNEFERASHGQIYETGTFTDWEEYIQFQ